MRNLLPLTALLCAGCAPTPPASVEELADSYLQAYGQSRPLEARLWGVETPAGVLTGGNEPEAVSDWQDMQARLLSELARIDVNDLPATQRAIHANLQFKLESAIALESCQRHLWPLNPYAGWHLNLVNSIGIAAQSDPEALTPGLIGNWARQLEDYLEAERRNLLAGLEQGYSVPHGNALAVAGQLENMVSDNGPLTTLANGQDEVIETAWTDAIVNTIRPAFIAHAGFIRSEYAARARQTHSLADLPEGAACYAASVFSQTGVRYTPDELSDVAEHLRQRAETRLADAGETLFGVREMAAIAAAYDALPGDVYETEAEALATIQADADRLIAESAYLFPETPEQSVQVEFYDELNRGSVTASYRPDFANGYAGVYRFSPDESRMRSRRRSEGVTIHEVAPGHHTQAMIGHLTGALGENPVHQIMTVGLNNAFVEGWGQYAEILAVEERLVLNPEIEVGIWQGYGQLIPLSVMFHTGRLDGDELRQTILELRGTPDGDPASAQPVVDWMGMMPAQLIAYDLGAETLLRLRDHAQAALGEAFSYPEFHRLVLEEGSVPLSRIEEKIDAWIAAGN